MELYNLIGDLERDICDSDSDTSLANSGPLNLSFDKPVRFKTEMERVKPSH